MLTRFFSEKIPLTHSRWMILLIFPFVSLSAKFITGSFESTYYLVAAMVACAWMLYRLKTFGPNTVAIWLIVLIFFATYFLRYPILLLDPTYVASTHPDSITPIFLNDQVSLISALKLSSFVFFIFCLVVGIQLSRNGGISNIAFYQTKENKYIKFLLLIAVPLLMVLLGYIAYVYKIGQMGVAPGEPMPYRLKGVIFYARHVLVPLLILALICHASFSTDRRLLYIGLALLVIHGVSDTLLRGSRSSLLLCLVLVGFLSASGGIRIQRRGMLFLGVLVLGAIFLMPTIMKYRAYRFESDASLWHVFLSAFSAANYDFLSTLKRSLNSFYFRIPGIETTWAISSLVSEPLTGKLIDVIRSPFGLTGYLSFDIYQVPVEAYTLYAPGFVGWLYLAGGWFGLMIGSILLALICVQLPRAFYSGYLRWPPLANTFFLWVLFISLTDGTLDSNFLLIATGLVTLAVLEFVDRAIKPSVSA